MEQYVIKGGIPLEGEVVIAGAKNAALGILAAAVMTDQEVKIENVPNVRDTRVLLQAIEGIGARVRYEDEHTVIICGGTIRPNSDLCVDDEFIRKIRASYYLLGALLGKYKHSQVALPGGCDIGARPIDLHIKGFEALGAKVDILNGMISTHADELIGNHIYMDVTSVGATINVMMAAVLAEGKTTIENAAKEPHIVDVHGTTYSIIPDQIEAGTFMMAAAATKGNILIKNVIPKHLEAITSKLLEIGARVIEYDDSVRVMCDKRLKSTNVKTLPYPGFPTDMQPQISVTLALSKGTSIVTESIFENRFKYVAELSRMGAKIRVEGNTAIIDGVETFAGAAIAAPDLRAGAALVIAALVADDYSTISDIKYIQRGYEKFEEKLQALGAHIEKVETEKDIQKFKLKIG